MGFIKKSLVIGTLVSAFMASYSFAEDAEHNIKIGKETMAEPWHLTLSDCAGKLLFISENYEIKDEKIKKTLSDNASMLATFARDRLVLDRKIATEEANKIAIENTKKSSASEWNSYWAWRAANMLDQKRDEKVGQCSVYFQEYMTTFPELFGQKK